MREYLQAATESGVGLTPVLGGALVVYRPSPLLTFGEKLLFRAAGNDGFRGVQFQQSLLSRAIIRSLGIPSHMFNGECNYSPWRSR